jgi:ABC-type thiamine transport system substrate-binding protein
MRKLVRSYLSSILFAFLSIVFLTGCTYFKKADESVDNTTQETVIPASQLKLEIVNQLGDTVSYNVDFTVGENVYEVLNRAMVENQDLKIVFDDFEVDGETAFFITTINSYDPSTESKFWSFYVNDEQSPVGISDYEPKAEDKISFKVEVIN